MTETPEYGELPLEVHIAADAETVWRALRDPDLVRRWLGWHYEGLDDEVRVIYVDGARADDAEHVLVVRGGDTFTLTPAPGGVVVRLTRAPRRTDPDWDAYYDDVTEGWTAFLQQLRFAVERHGLAERQTVALTGTLQDHASALDAALGLADAAQRPAGTRYQATLPTKDQISGAGSRTPAASTPSASTSSATDFSSSPNDPAATPSPMALRWCCSPPTACPTSSSPTSHTAGAHGGTPSPGSLKAPPDPRLSEASAAPGPRAVHRGVTAQSGVGSRHLQGVRP